MTKEYRAVWENENGSKRTGDPKRNVELALNDTLEDAEEFAGDMVAVEVREATPWRMVPLRVLRGEIK
jgi:hypothetical protein